MSGKMDSGRSARQALGSEAWWASVERCARLALKAWGVEGARELELWLEEDGFERAWQTRLLPSGELHVLARPAASGAEPTLQWQFSPEGLRACVPESFFASDRDLWELAAEPATTALAG